MSSRYLPVNEVFAARQLAHELLERAKRAVEIAIEKSEVEAIRFLEADASGAGL